MRKKNTDFFTLSLSSSRLNCLFAASNKVHMHPSSPSRLCKCHLKYKKKSSSSLQLSECDGTLGSLCLSVSVLRLLIQVHFIDGRNFVSHLKQLARKHNLYHDGNIFFSLPSVRESHLDDHEAEKVALCLSALLRKVHHFTFDRRRVRRYSCR